jgi:homopolymeric O-antigen transport system ATP-binding protein
MADIALSVKDLGKRYRIGQALKYKALRDSLAAAAAAPYRAARSLLSRGKPQPRDADSVFWAVKNVSFDIQRGEAVGIIGHNGAGKSTLLKMISRITEPTTGSALIRGRVGSLLEVGTGFHPELTGRENIYLNGAILGMRKAEIERKFDDIVSFAEVERFVDTAVKFYSSGMYVRLAFAVAAHLEPEILIIDEVLAVGDTQFQKKCIGKMQDVAGSGRTVLFVSHNLPVVNRLCTRALRMDRGEIVQDGTASEVTASYMRGIEDTGGARAWTGARAPGGEELRLTSVSIMKDGTPAAVVSVSDALELQIAYRVAKPGLRFRCLVPFQTQGVTAFTAIEPSEIPRDVPGEYVSSLSIPAHLLAEGEYSVDVYLTTAKGAKHHYAQLKSAITFLVFDPLDGTSARGDYGQNMGGVLRPRLAWSLHGRNGTTMAEEMQR